MTTIVSVTNPEAIGGQRGTLTDIPLLHRRGTENDGQGVVGFIGTDGEFYPFASEGDGNVGGSIAVTGESSITVTPSGGVGPFTYAWTKVDNTAGQAIVGATNTTSITVGANTTGAPSLYKVRITDALGNFEDVYYSFLAD